MLFHVPEWAGETGEIFDKENGAVFFVKFLFVLVLCFRRGFAVKRKTPKTLFQVVTSTSTKYPCFDFVERFLQDLARAAQEKVDTEALHAAEMRSFPSIEHWEMSLAH